MTDRESFAASLGAWRARSIEEQFEALGGPALIPVGEIRALQLKVRACPHREPPACGCDQVPATCHRPDQAGRQVWRPDCEACLVGISPAPAARPPAGSPRRSNARPRLSPIRDSKPCPTLAIAP